MTRISNRKQQVQAQTFPRETTNPGVKWDREVGGGPTRSGSGAGTEDREEGKAAEDGREGGDGDEEEEETREGIFGGEEARVGVGEPDDNGNAGAESAEEAGAEPELEGRVIIEEGGTEEALFPDSEEGVVSK